jgi:hypothetical protein
VLIRAGDVDLVGADLLNRRDGVDKETESVCEVRVPFLLTSEVLHLQSLARFFALCIRKVELHTLLVLDLRIEELEVRLNIEGGSLLSIFSEVAEEEMELLCGKGGVELRGLSLQNRCLKDGGTNVEEDTVQVDEVRAVKRERAG